VTVAIVFNKGVLRDRYGPSNFSNSISKCSKISWKTTDKIH